MLVLILGAYQLVYGACDRMVKWCTLNNEITQALLKRQQIGSKEKVLQETAGSDETDREVSVCHNSTFVSCQSFCQ